ncbi:hypothetical protein MAP00_004995 [Monascus purpureus]|nr:hypothetical protein MAP00_004995 [Monascus purpureus]
MMAVNKQPLGLLFDIGGVCVLSPFQAILDYEIAHNIPPGWVNFSISRTAPNGSWHKLERGEIKMDADFFAAFKKDLQNQVLWEKFQEYLQRKQKKTNASNHVSTPVPPMPEVDAERLFWEMMRISRTPDPYIFPALKRLKESGKFIIGALSNTVIFPDGHEYNTDDNGVKSQFDIFISSAHTGLRKPDRRVYELALKEMDVVAKKRGIERLAASDVVFLDDIGENLKGAKNFGMRTLKVNLGKTQKAVKELEAITGLHLLEDQEKARL